MLHGLLVFRAQSAQAVHTCLLALNLLVESQLLPRHLLFFEVPGRFPGGAPLFKRQLVLLLGEVACVVGACGPVPGLKFCRLKRLHGRAHFVRGSRPRFFRGKVASIHQRLVHPGFIG